MRRRYFISPRRLRSTEPVTRPENPPEISQSIGVEVLAREGKNAKNLSLSLSFSSFLCEFQSLGGVCRCSEPKGVGNELNQAEHEPVEDAPIVTVIQLLEYAL